jgi:hypothetical protein
LNLDLELGRLETMCERDTTTSSNHKAQENHGPEGWADSASLHSDYRCRIGRGLLGARASHRHEQCFVALKLELR